MKKIRVGLHGTRAHQIHAELVNHPFAELVAVSAFDKKIPEGCGNVRVYQTFDELVADGKIDLISLCSPKRSEQASQAVRAMKAGKHVYAEKPCALTEGDLDAIIAASRETGMKFHEMAGVAFARPYSSIRETIRSGAIGKVVQILAQKSYPWTERRPSDEDVDGGLGTQVAIYIPRFVEHVAGMKIASIEMVETRLGNPAPGHNCRMAVSVLMTLENGGVAVGVANYLNPIGSRVWGYEMLRVFGTGGVIESDPETGAVRLLAGGGEPAVVDAPPDGEDYFTLFAGSLLGQRTMPLTMEDELSPTRWIIRAKRAARLVR